jgi:transaldolase
MIYLDSADLKEAAAAAALGWVSGITTNPALMAKQSAKPLTHLRDLVRSFPEGPIFYQPASSEPRAAEEEAREAHAIQPTRIVVKLPATQEMFTLAFRLKSRNIPCAMTAVYSPGQAIMAHQVGCAWIIPYVDRARRLLDRGEDLIPSLAAVLTRTSSNTRILAASLKDPDQASSAVASGAHAVTLPMDVLIRLSEHPLTASAIAEFDRAVAETRTR